MKNFLKQTDNVFESSAKVVDGNLIISMPNAVNPIVWRMDLTSVKASALEIKKQDETGHFVLLLKTPKGEAHDIAPFESKESAVQALMRVSQAMQSAEGKITPQVIPSHTMYEKQAKSSGYKWLLALGAVLLAVMLFAFLGSKTTLESNISPEEMEKIKRDAGVPQSADEFLKGM